MATWIYKNKKTGQEIVSNHIDSKYWNGEWESLGGDSSLNPINLLENHIDTPIKKCIAGLNLLGIKTTMSCCGYTYDNELVPKKHLNKAYIYVDLTNTVAYKCENLLILSNLSGWTLSPLNNNIFDFYTKGWDKGHPWDDPKCPHFYEVFLLGINRLEKAIDKLQDKFYDNVTITDGNEQYQKEYGIKHWQYKPTEPWVVTPTIYKTL